LLVTYLCTWLLVRHGLDSDSALWFVVDRFAGVLAAQWNDNDRSEYLLRTSNTGDYASTRSRLWQPLSLFGTLSSRFDSYIQYRFGPWRFAATASCCCCCCCERLVPLGLPSLFHSRAVNLAHLCLCLGCCV
jgi:hypothetical protein